MKKPKTPHKKRNDFFVFYTWNSRESWKTKSTPQKKKGFLGFTSENLVKKTLSDM